MKVVIVTVPMRVSGEIKEINYPVEGNKSIEYDKSVRCPVNGVLAKTLEKDEEVRVIYIMTTGENSECEKNKEVFSDELKKINAEIGAVLDFKTVEISFEATNNTYNKLITDLTELIPENAKLYTDITYGFKPEILSLFCALRFAEEFCDATVEYFIYGKMEFHKVTREPVHEKCKLYDITSLYYLFKLIGTMGTTDKDSALKILKDFFAL